MVAVHSHPAMHETRRIVQSPSEDIETPSGRGILRPGTLLGKLAIEQDIAPGGNK